MDPRRWREGGRSLGESKINGRSKHIWLKFWFLRDNCHRTYPVLARGVLDVTSKEGEGSRDVESLKLKAEAEEQKLLDNLFFTFCCGDNLTCLKAKMVWNLLIDLLSLLFCQVCNGSFDCPDGEDEDHCEMETKTEDTEQLNKEEENFSNDLVSIHTKVAKEAQARLKEEAKVVMVDGRRAKVKRRRRLRKVVKESESDDRHEEKSMTKEEAETGKRNGVVTKVRRRKKVRKETGVNKLVIKEETDIEIKESNLTTPIDDEIETVATETTEIPQFLDGDTLSMTTESSSSLSETEEPMKEDTTELSTETVDHVGFERRGGGRVLFVGGRKVRVNKRRRQKAPTLKSLPVPPSSSDSDASSRSLPASSSSQLYSVEQLRQFLGQRPGQSQRQAANKGNGGEVPSDSESQITTEFPTLRPDRTPAAPDRSFQGTWLFDSFHRSESEEKLPEAKMSTVFTNPPLPGPALPPGFFDSFDAQFV